MTYIEKSSKISAILGIEPGLPFWQASILLLYCREFLLQPLWNPLNLMIKGFGQKGPPGLKRSKHTSFQVGLNYYEMKVTPQESADPFCYQARCPKVVLLCKAVYILTGQG